MRHEPKQTGFSLLEVVIVATLLGLLMHVVITLAASGSDAQCYGRRLNRVTEINQDVLDDIRLDLASSVSLFGRDAISQACYARIDFAGWPLPLNNAQLPRVADIDDFQPDASNPTGSKTGNMLFFAQRAWVDKFRCTSGNHYMTDVYQWTLYYLTRENQVFTEPIGINLVHWASEPMADAGQVIAIASSTDRTEVLQHLRDGSADEDGELREPMQLIWTRGQSPSVSGTFQQIDPVTASLSTVAISPRVDPFRIQAYRPLTRQGLLTLRNHSIATVYALPQPALYGALNKTGNGFPHGFEIQVIGPNAARQVLVRSTLISSNSHGLRARSTMQSVIDCRDL
ncbi:MAG: type II secretion system protein [Planctomycetota bacterium]